MMIVKQLQEAWSDYFKSNECEHLRFGQYVYNHYGFEINNSYNIVNASVAYQVLFEHLTNSLDSLDDLV